MGTALRNWWRLWRARRSDAAAEASRWQGIETLESRQLLSAPAVIKDLEQGAHSNLVEIDQGQFYLRIFNTTVTQVWKTDGTPAGTVLIKDAIQGENIGNLFEFGDDHLVFKTRGYLIPEAMWVSDGTEAGTVKLGDFGATDPVAVGDSIFFIVPQLKGFQVWKSDGTTQGTVMVREVLDYPEPVFSNDFFYRGIRESIEAGGRFFFRYQVNATVTELWTSDGTAEGTVKVDLGTKVPESLAEFQEALFLTVDPPEPGKKEALYLDAATMTTTRVLVDQASSLRLVAGQSTLFALGASAWMATGDAARQQLEAVGAWNLPTDRAAVVKGDVLLTAVGDSIWRADAGGTRLVRDVFSGNGFGVIFPMVQADDRLFFFLRKNEAPNRHLWSTDGTTEGTIQVAELETTHGGYLFPFFSNSTLKFFGPSPDASRNLWAMDITSRSLTTLSSSASTTKAGEPVTWSVTVTSPDGVPTGEVLFKEGSNNVIGSAMLDEFGRATFSHSGLLPKNYNVRALYLGDGPFTGAVSADLAHTVLARPVNLIVEQLDPSGRFSVEVKPAEAELSVVPQGYVYLSSDDSNWQRLDAAGRIEFSPGLTPGNVNLTVVYVGEGFFAASSAPVSISVPREPSLVSLEAIAPTHVLGGERLRVNAAVTTDSPYHIQGRIWIVDAATNKIVRFSDFGGTHPVSLDLTLPAGTHRLKAVYSGNDELEGSTSAEVTVSVDQQAKTELGLHIEESGSGARKQWTLHTYVYRWGSHRAGGSVRLFDHGTLIKVIPISRNEGDLPLARLAPGEHRFTAEYSGDEWNAPSAALELKYNTVSATITTLKTTAIGTSDKPVTLTATVAAASDGSPATGKVRFYRRGQSLGLVSLVNGQAKLTVRLPEGQHRIQAQYLGVRPLRSSKTTPQDTTIYHPTVVDLMVLYAESAAGRTGSIQSRIRQAVADANQVFRNSEIKVSLRLVYAGPAPFEENSNYRAALSALSRSDEVADLRRKYGADLVSLFLGRGTDELLGVAQGMTRLTDPRNPDRAHSVVSAAHAAGYYHSLAHELGHNFGALHDPGNADPPQGIFRNAYGHRVKSDGGIYRDVMSYAPGARIPYFSNPDITYFGLPLGTKTANAAWVIRQTSRIVSAYMPQKRPYGADPFAR